MRGGAGRLPVLATVLAVLVLVGMVAVASTGSTGTGTSDSRRPSDVLFDTLFSLALVALVPAAALVAYGLTQRRAIAQEIASGRYRRTSLTAWLVFVLVFSAVAYFRLWNSDFTFGFGDGGAMEVGPDSRVPAPSIDLQDKGAYQAEFAWIPVLVVVGLALAGALAYVFASRRARSAREAPDGELAERLADVLDDTLDDLRAERDPRRAVIAAYARLERALAAASFPRHESETADEFVARLLDRLDVDHVAVHRLTALFARAKFSQHEVDVAMKDEAIGALAQVRDELRAAARRLAEDEREPGEQAAAVS